MRFSFQGEHVCRAWTFPLAHRCAELDPLSQLDMTILCYIMTVLSYVHAGLLKSYRKDKISSNSPASNSYCDFTSVDFFSPFSLLSYVTTVIRQFSLTISLSGLLVCLQFDTSQGVMRGSQWLRTRPAALPMRE